MTSQERNGLWKNQIHKPFLLYSMSVKFFNKRDPGIQQHCHNTQKQDRHDQPIHLKEVKGQKDKMTIVLFMVDSANKFNFRDSEIVLRKIWRL